MKFQIGTSSENNHGGVRKLPYVFTEQGVAMLAFVLHTAVAEEVSIKIMRSFVKMRKYFANNSGASFKELGKRCFCIYENNDKDYLQRILKTIGISR